MHRLDFRDAGALFDGRPRLEGPASYRDEPRLSTVAILDDAFVTLIWTWRHETRRAISFRRARDGERDAYRQVFRGRVEGDG
ncbi:BrnT family toxin [uncultured Methylobacterium sp.]|uniref:BrnT family toxin n=1 Tax=uncultured Methylobacterium sp. TaxID=157278 RepID=UPI0035C9B23E